MRKIALIIFLMLISLSALAKPATIISPFIKAQRQAFADAYAYRTDKGIQKEFGYGAGIYINTEKDVTTRMPFEWFAYCGTDGFVMFEFSVLVNYQDRYKIMLETAKFSERPWDAVIEENETRIALDSKWIGCVAKKDCNYRAILDDYLQKFMKFSFFVEMKATVYL